MQDIDIKGVRGHGPSSVRERGEEKEGEVGPVTA